MAKSQVVKLGFYVSPELTSEKMIMDYLSDKMNLYGRILFSLRDYLVKYTKTFDKAYILTSSEDEKIFPNDSLEGLKRSVNQKEMDIAVQPFLQYELREKFVDFSYSFEMLSATFMTHIPESPEVLGILKTFS